MIGRKRSLWIWIVYWAVSAGLRVLYVRINGTFGFTTLAASIPASWWLLAFFYFVVDVAFVLAAKLFLWILTPREKRKPFLFEVAGIVPVWLLLHMVMLFFEYPVSSRLEAVGLGGLELVVFMAFTIVAAAEILRSFASYSKTDD